MQKLTRQVQGAYCPVILSNSTAIITSLSKPDKPACIYTCLPACSERSSSNFNNDNHNSDTIGQQCCHRQHKQAGRTQLVKAVQEPVNVALVTSISPVIAIFADHFDVPSRTLCLTAFMWPEWHFLSTLNTCLKTVGAPQHMSIHFFSIQG